MVNRVADEHEVINLMKTHELNLKPKGQKSPLSLFLTAHNAFITPITDDNPVSTSLIPLREAIRLTIDHFLKRRPFQEETRNEINKVISIGKQLAYNTISHETIETWAQQWDEILRKQLSTSKDQDLTRDEWHFRLRQGTLWLKAFLSGLDPSKTNRKINKAA